MSVVAPAPERWTSERYLAFVAAGQLRPEDRVELLEGVVVSVAPHTTRHASCVSAVMEALARAVGGRASLRIQLPLRAGPRSVPEPDVAVVAGKPFDYATSHPDSALLVVEVAETSLPQDRLTKAGIYAAAGISEYWIVNLTEDRVEVFRAPRRRARRYVETTVVGRGQRLSIAALPGTSIAVDDLLPPSA